ncbi:PD-(D/E)XK nuclease family protein [Bacteroidota bacterium]|nr:PD-(D/E)XK nuclease family protein [Bacteroidota bacterium]
MDSKKLKLLYDELLNDIDFDELELGLGNPNIFEILKVDKLEIRHSNFLSWLLNPMGSHKIGNVFLKRFLREVFSSDKFKNIDQIDVEGMDLSNVKILREWNNIDVLIKVGKIIVCIENKFLSKEDPNQLLKYKNIIESHFPKHKQTFVFLTPEGNSSLNEKDVYQPMSYDFIVDSLEKIISIYGSTLNQQVLFYIKDYITVIKRVLMKTDKLTKLSQKIYTNHKEILDFIYENKPDFVLRVGEVMKSQIQKRGWSIGSCNKNYIRFSTPKIKDLIYINKNKNGWTNRESCSFEIELYELSKNQNRSQNKTKNKVLFKWVTSPCDERYNRKRLVEIVSSIDGFKTGSGTKWSTNYSKTIPFSNQISSMTDNQIIESVDSFLDKTIDVVKLLEDKFLSHSSELKKMKNV